MSPCGYTAPRRLYTGKDSIPWAHRPLYTPIILVYVPRDSIECPRGSI